MDVAAFTTVLLVAIWVLQPLTGGRAVLLPAAVVALALAAWSLRRRGIDAATQGLALRGAARAVPVYVGCGLLYTLPWLAVLGGRPHWEEPGVLRSAAHVATSLAWAFLQQYCLLSFLLVRLRSMTGRPPVAVIGAAVLFATFHLPNPFLTGVTLGAGLVLGALFLWRPSTWAAALAHAQCSGLLSTFIPAHVTGDMKTGPFYWAPPG